MAQGNQFHENLQREHDAVILGDRSFGIVFTEVFGVVGCWPLLSGGGVRLWALAISMAFLICALFRQSLLSPLNKNWTRFSLILNRFVNPVVMGLIFYLSVVPTGFVMGLLGKDLLKLKRDPEAKSYCMKREPPRPYPKWIRNQF